MLAATPRPGRSGARSAAGRGSEGISNRVSPGGRVIMEGPLAQLVAHLHDAQGVRGSSPLRPTDRLTSMFVVPTGTVREPSGTIGSMEFTAAITHDDDWYVARCLEVEVTSQGESVDEALANLKEALELYFEDEALPEDLEAPIIATLRLSA
jgi:predicted RNase H-like HicB family nuclease